MITVDMRDRKPIYEQLIDNIRSLAVQGILQPDEHLPSVRQLAAELAINPNTIQKAYQELERQNVIYSLPGRGNFVSGDIRGIQEQEQRRVGELLRTHLQAAKSAGLTREALQTIIDDVYRKDKEDDPS